MGLLPVQWNTVAVRPVSWPPYNDLRMMKVNNRQSAVFSPATSSATTRSRSAASWAISVTARISAFSGFGVVPAV